MRRSCTSSQKNSNYPVNVRALHARAAAAARRVYDVEYYSIVGLDNVETAQTLKLTLDTTAPAATMAQGF